MILKWLIPFARALRKTWNSRLAYWRKESSKIKKLFLGKNLCQEAGLAILGTGGVAKGPSGFIAFASHDSRQFGYDENKFL